MAEDYGEQFESWEFPEYHQHERGRVWYTVFFVIAGLLVLYSLATYNFLFLVIILIAGAVYVVTGRRQPAMLRCTIWEDGVTVNDKLYRYDSLEKFWIIYNPPESKYLYLRLKGALRPDLVIALENANPVKVRDGLLRFVPEDATKEEESVAEVLGKRYKL